MQKNESIDFVITWVDGDDPKWKKEKEQYSKKNDSKRFRDWDNLQYWFRAVEKYAPWVINIQPFRQMSICYKINSIYPWCKLFYSSKPILQSPHVSISTNFVINI